MHLTKTVIDAAKHPGGDEQFVLWDDRNPGFGVRVYPSGRKTFIMRYRNAGNRYKYLTLGRFGTLTLQQARDLATQRRGDVVKGEDPAEEKASRRRALDVAQLCELFLERYAKPHRKSWKDDERRIGRHIVPHLGPHKAGAVTKSDVIRMHQKVAELGPVEANRTLNLVRRIWNLAEEWEILPEGTKNPTKGVKRFAEKSRERWLTDEEAKRLLRALERDSGERGVNGSLCFRIDEFLRDRAQGTIGEVAEAVDHPRQKTAILLASMAKQGRLRRVRTGVYAFEPGSHDPDPFFRAIIWLYLLTGLRKTELLGLRWEHVDFDQATVYVPDTKSGRSHLLPLSTMALDILRGLPRFADNPHCFPGRKPGEPLANIDKSWRRLRALAGLEDVTIHDLRRTVGSWLVQDGQSLVIVQRALNHQTYDAALRYAKLHQEPVRAALEAQSRRLKGAFADVAARYSP